MSFNRSVSPQTVERSPGSRPGLNWRGRIGRVLSFFKNNDSRPNGSVDLPVSLALSNGVNNNSESPFQDGRNPFLAAAVGEPLQNNFLLEKRRRMSVQALRNKSGYIPRSSTVNAHPGLYQTYAENLETEQEGLNNHLERRLSTTYNSLLVKDTPGGIKGISVERELHDQSPLMPIAESMGALSPPPTRFDAESTTLQYGDLDVENDIDRYNNNSIVTGLALVESEYAPLYTDEEGNLVRPPFINLDPKERYELLKMKRAMRERQHLQSRLKYMVDPNETTSVSVDHNMVDTSTQTHDSTYLDKSLHFVNLKRKLKSNSGLRSAKRRKHKGGYFAAEFYYDVNDNLEHKKLAASKYDGYLGLVSKPLFRTTAEKTTKNGKRHDLESALESNAKIRLPLDSEFIKEKESLANVVKIKEPVSSSIGMSNSDKIPVSQPSAGFTFNINKSDIQSIVSQRKESDRETAEKAQGLKHHEVSDNADDQLPRKRKAPSSNFTTTSSASISLPKLSFGANNGTTIKPSSGGLFGSSTSTTPTVPPPSLSSGLFKGSGESTASTTTSTLPKLNFGVSESSNNNEQTSSIGRFSAKRTRDDDDDEDKNKEGSKPTVSFSLNTTEGKAAPLFGGSKVPPPKFSFGKSALPAEADSKVEDSAPPKLLFSFGGSSEKKDTTPTPGFAFGGPSSKPELTKPESGSKSDAPKSDALPNKEPILFGGSAPKPLFAFGNNASTTGTAVGLTFSFGGTTTTTGTPKPAGDDKKEEAGKPTFSFGNAANKKEASGSPKPFSFGAVSPTPEATGSKPLFAFGGKDETSATNTKPIFGLGTGANNVSTSTVGSQTTKDNGSVATFSFGDSANKDPALIFGATTSSTTPAQAQAATTSSTSAPAFSFGRAPVLPNESAAGSTALIWGGGSGRATPVLQSGSASGSGTGFSFGGNNKPFSTQTGTSGPSGSGFSFGASSKPEGAASSGFGFSRETTPINTNGPPPAAFALPIFGQTNGGSRSGMGLGRGFSQPPPAQTGAGGSGFNFTGSISSKENTPDPSAIFGGLNNSASNVNINPGGGFGFDASSQGTPVISGRKIAHPRRRGGR